MLNTTPARTEQAEHGESRLKPTCLMLRGLYVIQHVRQLTPGACQAREHQFPAWQLHTESMLNAEDVDALHVAATEHAEPVGVSTRDA